MTYTNQELSDWLRTCATDGNPPKMKDVDKANGPTVGTYLHRFGSWSDALTAAGFEPELAGRQYSSGELLDHLHTIAEDGVAPTKEDTRVAEGPSPSTYQYRFASWSEALLLAGFGKTPAPEYTDQTLIDHLQQLGFEDIPPTIEQVQAADGPAVQNYYQRFGTWKRALTMAGFATE